MELITILLDIANEISKFFTDFTNTLTSPIAEVLGTQNNTLVSIMNFVLGLFGTDIYNTTLLTFILGFGVSFFVLFHFVKFIVGIIT